MNNIKLLYNIVMGVFIKKIVVLVVSIFLVFSFLYSKTKPKSKGGKMEITKIENFAKNNIVWFGHESILIRAGNKKIFIDPWKLKDVKEKADIILITHSHFDHYSEDDIQKISTDKTILYSSEDVVSQTKVKNKKVIKPFEELKSDGIIIKAMPAYNKNKDFHPKRNNWLGFIVSYDNISVYVTGDSDDISNEFANKGEKINIAMVPVGGTYTMDANEAADFVNTIKPDIAIPIHWGDIVGSKSDAEKFKSLVKNPIMVIIK